MEPWHRDIVTVVHLVIFLILSCNGALIIRPLTLVYKYCSSSCIFPSFELKLIYTETHSLLLSAKDLVQNFLSSRDSTVTVRTRYSRCLLLIGKLSLTIWWFMIRRYVLAYLYSWDSGMSGNQWVHSAVRKNWASSNTKGATPEDANTGGKVTRNLTSTWNGRRTRIRKQNGQEDIFEQGLPILFDTRWMIILKEWY